MRVISTSPRLEIWSRKRWDAFLTESQQNFEQIAEKLGREAHLVDDPGQIAPSWFEGATRVGGLRRPLPFGLVSGSGKLGGGVFGMVYKARKESIGKDYAIKFLNGQNDDRPFFLYLAYTAPHWPLQRTQWVVTSCGL